MTAPEQPAGAASPERPKKGGKKPPLQSPVDTESLVPEFAGSGKTLVERLHETESERESRLRIKEEDARAEREEKKAGMDQRRWVECVILIVSLIFSAVVCIACLFALFDKGISPQDKAWAAPILTLIVGGLTGFWTGRTTNRLPEK